MDRMLVVDRTRYSLTLWRLGTKWRRSRAYPIAIGALGYETPPGVRAIVNKSLNPDWLPPDSPWVGPELRDPETGEPILIEGGDKRNPLKGAFLDLDGPDGVGIHGTAAEWSLGSGASHGCIRMAEEDVLDLYDRVSIGTLVVIV